MTYTHTHRSTGPPISLLLRPPPGPCVCVQVAATTKTNRVGAAARHFKVLLPRAVVTLKLKFSPPMLLKLKFPPPMLVAMGSVTPDDVVYLRFVRSFSVQFNSHLFLSPIGARTLKMPVPYSPPNAVAYTRTPSHQPLVFGRKGIDHLP